MTHESSTARTPNVVLICTDQWRGDCLSINGHPIVRTPYLDAIATEGANFSNAYSSTPTCVPARMALMTGLTARSHRRVGYTDGIDFDLSVTLPGEFTKAGYQTQAIGKMHYYPERGRVGFNNVILHDGYLNFARKRGREVDWYDDYLVWLRGQAGESAVSDYFDDGINCNSVVARPWSRSESLHPTNWVVTEATSWLYRRDPTVPFFLYLSFHRPHPPYNPPAWAFEQYLNLPDHEPPVGDWVADLEDYRTDYRPDAHVATYDQQTLNRARAGYYGNITHIDHQIARFMDVLREFGLKEDTYIVFTSDHGEMLGDHDLWRKGYPYEGSSRVPLLISGPGIRGGQRVDALVELRDLMPTLLDAAHLPVPGSIDGISLFGLTQADEQGSNVELRPYLHGEHVLLGQSIQWVRAGSWKYIWFSKNGNEQLFDLHNDPEETRNLSEDPGCRTQLLKLRASLIAELSGRPEEFVQSGQLIPGQAVVTLLPKES